MSKFSADEIFEMAEQIERNGASFYHKAAAQTANEQTRQVLEDLARMEDEHGATFAAMRAELTGAETAHTSFDPQGQVGLYLRAFVDGKVFDVGADPAAQLSGSETLQEVLGKAIALEKDSIVFYLGIRQVVPGKLGAEKIERIIQEEMSHIRILSDALDAGIIDRGG